MAYEALHESEEGSADQNLVAVGVFYFEDSNMAKKSPW
jgi:hypothetical protein